MNGTAMPEAELLANTSRVVTSVPSPALEMSGGKFIASTLKGYGVTHVFFMESVLRQTLIEMEALGIRRVLTHSEAAAVYMADGYARISRRPGVCMAQSVGAANLAAAMQDPWLGLSPVLALTGKKLPAAQHRNAYQEIRHDPMFEPVTKFNVAVETLEQLPRLLRQALREATSGAPGPVHLDIAGGFAGEAIDGGKALFDVIVEPTFARFPALRTEPELERLREVAALLAGAERPVIVAGGGARSSGAGAELLRLAQRLQIPVATSLNAKGIIPEDHPLCAGVVGSYSRWCGNRIVAEADLVLFVGSHTGDQVTNNWTVPAVGTRVIQIDIDPAELGRSYPNAVAVAGDARVSLAKLAGLLNPVPGKTPWSRYCEGLVQQWVTEFSPLLGSDAFPIRTERLCHEITEFLPSNAIVVSDTGYSGIWSGAMISIRHAEQDYLRAAGSLGWGMPAAMGAKCAAPNRPVIAFVGDGGFWYHMSELETALRCGINTVTVINNNHGFGQCIDAINRNYANRTGNRGDLYQFTDVDFAAIANEIGCFGIRVERPEDIAGALAKALASGRPAVVDVVTDVECRAPAPWSPPKVT
jgi:acetolactate synthase I/II/III large subunit